MQFPGKPWVVAGLLWPQEGGATWNTKAALRIGCQWNPPLTPVKPVWQALIFGRKISGCCNVPQSSWIGRSDKVQETNWSLTMHLRIVRLNYTLTNCGGIPAVMHWVVFFFFNKSVYYSPALHSSTIRVQEKKKVAAHASYLTKRGCGSCIFSNTFLRHFNVNLVIFLLLESE